MLIMNWQMGICVFYLSTRESIENRPIWVISKGSFCHPKKGGGGGGGYSMTKQKSQHLLAIWL